VDLLNIRLMQAIPSVRHDGASAGEGQLQGHLDQDIAALRTFLHQLRHNELSSSAYRLGEDLTTQLRQILQQGEELVGQLERSRDQLDPAGPPNVPRLQDGAARVEATGS
jgi:hypothetical protein